jgi:hypothetical protein
MIGVITVIDVGHLQAGFEDGGFDGHDGLSRGLQRFSASH